MKNIVYYIRRFFSKLKFPAIKNSKIHRHSKIGSGSVLRNVKMDKHSYCGENCNIISCEIGSYTSIASNVVIGGYEHPTNWLSTSPVFYEGSRTGTKKKVKENKIPKLKKTVIGNDVWIGNNVLIKSGVNIGHGAVIGMGSVVIKDVKSYTIVAGNPAKPIKKRFNDEIINNLLEIEWWTLDEKLLSNCTDKIEDIEYTLECLRSYK